MANHWIEGLNPVLIKRVSKEQVGNGTVQSTDEVPAKAIVHPLESQGCSGSVLVQEDVNRSRNHLYRKAEVSLPCAVANLPLLCFSCVWNLIRHGFAAATGYAIAEFHQNIGRHGEGRKRHALGFRASTVQLALSCEMEIE